MKKSQIAQNPEGQWLKKNLERLIKNRPGDFVVVIGNEGFIDKNLQKALTQAKKMHPRVRPLIMEIPKEKDFLHVLIFFSLYHS
ncbi:hypothetical protein HY946_03035 [Candidatus Gottesmanbacteria bacterium]|nr:hypothetical protein [Candidatus Gottesmanbacteria bacterium]